MQHSYSSEITAQRVFEGSKGCVLNGDGSTGDYPYGYTSKFRDSDEVRLAEKRKSHFRKDVVIYEPAAAIIRLIFSLFIGGMRIAAIARQLIKSGIVVPPNRRGTTKFKRYYIALILKNPKYTGEWCWGVSRSLRDSDGISHLHAREGGPAVQVTRSNLRIIDDDTWAAAQKLLAGSKECYGVKANETKPRGVGCDFRILHAKTLTRGLIYCSACGAKMTVTGSTKGGKNVGCPNRLIGTCDRRALVPVELAEQKVGECSSTALCADHVWLPKLMASMRLVVDAVAAEIPRQHERLRGDLDTTNKAIANIVDFIIKGNGSEALGVQLKSFEVKKGELEHAIESLKPVTSFSLPNESWIREHLSNLGQLLQQADPEALLLMRTMIGKIIAEPVISPGKKNVYSRLRFSLDVSSAVATLLTKTMPPAVLAILPAVNAAEAIATFTIDLGKPTRAEALTPKVVELRQAGKSWEMATGLGKGHPAQLYKRYLASFKDGKTEQELSGSKTSPLTECLAILPGIFLLRRIDETRRQ